MSLRSPRLACSIALISGLLASLGCHRTQAPTAKAIPRPIAKSVPRPTVATSPPKPPALRVSPALATLGPGDLGLQLIVEGTGTHGGRRDQTSAVAWEAGPSGIVTIAADGYVRPLRPGKATIRGTLGRDRVSALVTVADGSERPWDFAADVMPILTHAGCNAGGCHGRTDGQNGFHLSIFGYDPEGDFRALTREADGRRISLIDPDQSLILRKATGRIPHVGGLRLSANSDEYQTVRAWIAAGAPESRGRTHGAMTRLAVEPAEVRLEEPGPLQVRVVAHFADGHDRDVTRLATFAVKDDSAAQIDPNGRAILLRRAETDLIVRFRSDVVSTRLATLINPDLKFDFVALPRRNFIDKELFKRLESLKVPPSPTADDAAFLRRVTLDLIGQQPTPQDVREFLKETDPDKRVKRVDQLLKNRDFVRFWQIKLGDMLQISSTRFPGGSGYYQMWLNARLTENAPWDAMVRELLTSLGDPNTRGGGPVNYALDGPDAKVQAEQTAQRFLGLRLRCAQCHDHPFDVWTQDDYYGLAAFFAKTGRAGGPGMMGASLVKVDPKGKIDHPRTKRPAEPRLLGGEPVKVADADDPRRALADWMTKPDNPFFARAMANWVWAQFFGKGLADPADDLGRSNPPVHPELLDALARHFVEHQYDLRDLIRTVATSEAYGLASATRPGNEHDSRLFSHQVSKPLTAHQMADALAQVTDVINRYRDRPPGTRAVEVNDPAQPSTILDTFGRCSRTNGCSAVATPELSLRQSLLLIGGNVLDEKVAHPRGYLANLLQLNPEPGEVVENLYLRTLCRPPTADELDHWTGELKKASSFSDAAEDLFWALLNSREFAFNH